MLFESFASRLDTKTEGLPKNAHLERWLVHPNVPIEETFDHIAAVMNCRGYTYDYAERTDMYFSKSGTQVQVTVLLLRGDALEHLQNTFPDGRIPDQEAIVIEYFEQPILGV